MKIGWRPSPIHAPIQYLISKFLLEVNRKQALQQAHAHTHKELWPLDPTVSEALSLQRECTVDMSGAGSSPKPWERVGAAKACAAAAVGAASPGTNQGALRL